MRQGKKKDLRRCPECGSFGKIKIHISEFTKVKYCGKCNLVLEPWSFIDYKNISLLKRAKKDKEAI